MHYCVIIKPHSHHFLGYRYRRHLLSFGAAFFQTLSHGGVETVFQVAVGFAAVLVFSELAGIELGDFGLAISAWVEVGWVWG